MRDPQAHLESSDKYVIRHIIEKLHNDHPLCNGNLNQLVSDGLLIPHEWFAADQVRSPRIPFVSSPEEWTDAQFYDAAVHTLTMLERTIEIGADLKDASAWNVIFDGCRPVFCDLTSIVPLQAHSWWAAGQFVRHFISPLWLAKSTGFQASDMFRISRDGVPSVMVRNTIGWRRFFNRCWPLVAEMKGNSTGVISPGLSNSTTQRYRECLIASLRWMLDGVKPAYLRYTSWGQYAVQREHYDTHALRAKRETVKYWLFQLKPAWVLDLGCNKGEFSEFALEANASVIAVDGDHDALQSIYKKHVGNNKIFPVLALLDDIHSGRGWAGSEHTGLAQRLVASADLLMMLALIHHLSIAAAIPLMEVARFAALCTRRWLIIEWLGVTDSQLRLLCIQRQRDPNHFGIEMQRAAFINAGFSIISEVALPNSSRVLALLERTSINNN